MGEAIAQICCSPLQQGTQITFWKHFHFELLFVSLYVWASWGHVFKLLLTVMNSRLLQRGKPKFFRH